MMRLDLERVRCELMKQKSKQFVRDNYEDIAQEACVLILKGMELKQAVDEAIRLTKKAIGTPKLKYKRFVSWNDEIDIAAHEENPIRISVKKLSPKQRKTLYRKFRTLSQVILVLNRLNISGYSLLPTNNQYDEAYQISKLSCPICGTRNHCFTIYHTVEYGKPRFSYSCHTIPKGEHYKKYPNNLDGIFMSLLGLSKIKTRKLILHTIQELIE